MNDVPLDYAFVALHRQVGVGLMILVPLLFIRPINITVHLGKGC